MERLDQGHLHPLLEVPRLTYPEAVNQTRASTSKELFKQWVNSYSEHLHMSPRNGSPSAYGYMNIQYMNTQYITHMSCTIGCRPDPRCTCNLQAVQVWMLTSGICKSAYSLTSMGSPVPLLERHDHWPRSSPSAIRVLRLTRPGWESNPPGVSGWRTL